MLDCVSPDRPAGRGGQSAHAYPHTRTFTRNKPEKCVATSGGEQNIYTPERTRAGLSVSSRSVGVWIRLLHASLSPHLVVLAPSAPSTSPACSHLSLSSSCLRVADCTSRSRVRPWLRPAGSLARETPTDRSPELTASPRTLPR